MDWIYGVHPVLELLRSRPRAVRKLWIAAASLVNSGRREARMGEILDLARRNHIHIFSKAPSTLRSGHHQGVAALVEPRNRQGLSEFLSQNGNRGDLLLVALDEIVDPQNLGAILRNAACLGAAGVLLPEHRSAPVSSAAVRASSGAAERIPVFSVGNLAQALRSLKKSGFWIYGADLGRESLKKFQFRWPLVLVLGSEGKGVRPLIRSLCDSLVSIPQSGGVESLNVSSASAIFLYEIQKQRLY